MDTLENFSATPIRKTTRTKTITLFVTTLLFAMLAISATVQAQAISNSTATLTGNPPTLVVTAINAARFYGDPNPSFTGTITGLQSGDNITATYAAVADTSSAVGDYLIIPTLIDPDNKLGNYVV